MPPPPPAPSSDPARKLCTQTDRRVRTASEIWYSETQHDAWWNIANSLTCREACCLVRLAYHSVHVLLLPYSCIVFRFLLRGPDVPAPVAVSMPRVSGCTVVMETSGALALALALAPGLILWAGPERLLPEAWSVLVPLEPGEGGFSRGSRGARRARACRLASDLASLSKTRVVLETTWREVTDDARLILSAILSVALVSDVIASSGFLFLLAIASVVHVSKVVIIGGVAIATHSVTTPTPSGKNK